MILYTQDCKVFVNGVRRVLIDVVKMKADPVSLADTAAVCVCLQKALPLGISWIGATHAKFIIEGCLAVLEAA